MSQIVEYLELISQGIDPATGEVLEIEELKKDPSFIKAFAQLKRVFKGHHADSRYKEYEKQFPDAVIVMKEGYFFAAHNASAVVLNHILDYRTFVDSAGRTTTGGPDIEKIIAALEAKNYSFVFVEMGSIVKQACAANPFQALGIDPMLCLPSHLAEKDLLKKQGKTYPWNILKELCDGRVTSYPDDAQDRLEYAMRHTLPEREQSILYRPFQEGYSLQSIGKEYGMSRERARQLISRSMKRLRREDVLSYVCGEAQAVPTKPQKVAASAERLNRADNAASEQSSSEDSISISELVRRIKVQKDPEQSWKLTYNDVAEWLISHGYMVKEKRTTDSLLRRPTALGERIGIHIEARVGEKGEYLAVLLNQNAQRFIMEHLDDILEGQAN